MTMITVEDILMTKGPDVVTAPPSTTIREAVVMMCEAGVGSVIIKDADELRGIFTERDLLHRVVAPGKDPETTELYEVMSSPIQSVPLHMDVRKCGDIFTNECIRHLAIVEEGALLGMISLRDIIVSELNEDEEILHGREHCTAP
jgi:signal-transduction protein with cAMP-binding, CBS, and nucleotidyltransferase domain